MLATSRSLFENWNRFYDPSTGRYTASDAMLRSPTTSSLPEVYIYASNTPLMKQDADANMPKFIAWIVRRTANGIQKVRKVTRQQALNARRRGEEVSVEGSRHMKKLAKDASREGGGGGKITHVETSQLHDEAGQLTGVTGVRHVHSKDAAGGRLPGHVFQNPELKTVVGPWAGASESVRAELEVNRAIAEEVSEIVGDTIRELENATPEDIAEAAAETVCPIPKLCSGGIRETYPDRL